MICEKCKAREATLVFTEVINGIKTEHAYCKQCASESEWAQILEKEFPFKMLLSEILAMQNDTAKTEVNNYNHVACPTCKMTYAQFLEKSQFGCANCYNTFGILIDDNIKKLQGSDTHCGKTPRYWFDENTGTKSKTPKKPHSREEVLRLKLEEALREEEYELAAKYRDELRDIAREKHDE